MLLVRHNRLQKPYDDYAGFHLATLDALATDKVSPDIQPLPAALPFGEDALRLLRDAEIVCSTSARTQQTAKAVMEKIGREASFSIDARLNEIAFTPSQMWVEGNPLQAVRDTLYPRLNENAPGVENREALQSRVDSLIETYLGKNAALFTHGFLIRVIRGRCAHPQDFSAALAAAQALPSVDYLENCILKPIP